MTDREILDEIGKLLWSIFPSDAHTIVLEGQFYSGHDQCGPVWYDQAGKRLGPSDYRPLMDIIDQMRSFAQQLQQTSPFDNEPFTHMKYSLTEDSKMDVKFAYIPEWDSWPGLYMRGVSQVAKDELIDNNIPVEAWKECRARFEREPYTLPTV